MYKSKKKCLEDVVFRINMVLKPLLLSLVSNKNGRVKN